jgi:hypothetical protein
MMSQQRDEEPVVWLNDRVEEGYRMGRQGESLVMEWPTIARLTCRADGTRARLVRTGGGGSHDLSKLRGVMKALLADVRGGLGLHASAVAVGRRGVLFLGESGAGKSTAAASLCRLHRARLLADDAAMLDQTGGRVRLAPSEDRHYLMPQAREALGFSPSDMKDGLKEFVRPAHAASRPVGLELVVCLRFDDKLAGPVTRWVRGAEAAHRMLGAMFRFDVTDRRGDLDRVLHVYRQAPFVEISRPKAHPDISELVLAILRGIHGS